MSPTRCPTSAPYPGPRLCWVPVIAFCLCAQAQCQPIAPEVSALCSVTSNGGFEEGSELPDYWAHFPPEPQPWGRHLRDTTDCHAGTASGKLLSDEPHPPGAGVQWNRYGLPVKGGSALIVSYWMKTQGTRPIGTGCHFYDADKAHLGFVPVRPAGDCSDWTYTRAYVDVPASAITAGFALYGGDSGSTWYDDVHLLGVPSIQATRGTPTVDGALDDPCWQSAQQPGPFALHTGEGLADPQPRALITYDDDALYFAFDCPHRLGVALTSNATAHDGNVWLDDSIEVFLAPARHKGAYYQLCVNSLGVMRDSRGQDASWGSGATATTSHGDGHWTAELRVPYEHLGIDLSVGATWGINLVHNNRTAGQTSTWSLGGFHRPGRFGLVSLSPDLTRFYLPDLARGLQEKERSLQALKDEVAAVGLEGPAEARFQASVEKAAGSLAQLRQVQRPEDVGPDGWQGLDARLEGIEQALAEARSAAVDGLFGVGEGESGFRVAIAHSLQKVRRDGPVTDGVLAREVQLQAAADESESFQLVVVPNGQDLKGMTVEAGPLTGPEGSLPLAWHRVGYVETARPKYQTEYVGWWPDPLLPAGPFDLSGLERRPIWCTVNVPPDVRPGVYRGEVRVSHGEQTVSVPVELRVRSFRLPRPGTLATPFSLYADALKYWWWPKQKYAEHMPIEMFRDWCRFLGTYRLTPKNIGREYITQTRQDGTLTVDLSALDQTVKPLNHAYFAPYSFNLHRLPSAAGMDKTAAGQDALVAAADTRAFADAWERAGLPTQVYIYGYDEPQADQYPFIRSAYEAIREAVPGYPIMQTLGDANPEGLAGAVDIWCPLTPALTGDFYRKRLAAGDTLWAYVCCGPSPPYANFFVDEPATDHRILFWQLRQAGGTGFLYWSTSWWDGLPNAASGEPCFPDVPIHFSDLGTYKQYGVNGDGLLLYPGRDHTPLPSVRLEVIRDGIEDYEYLALLSRLLQQVRNLSPDRRPSAETLAAAEKLTTVPDEVSQSMTAYTKDPRVILQRRERVGDMIEVLAEALNRG